jgi:hypothetical protein
MEETWHGHRVIVTLYGMYMNDCVLGRGIWPCPYYDRMKE